MDDSKLLSDDTNNAITEFVVADKAYKDAVKAFYENHEQELEQIDKLRDERNRHLDSSKRGLRADAAMVDITKTKIIKVNPFKVQKKWSPHYITEMFVELAKNQGIYDEALEAGVLVINTIIPNFARAKEWVQTKNADEVFKQAEDGVELTPAVTGPKEVPPLGAELK